jgi:superfamily II DNA/RNA helicase
MVGRLEARGIVSPFPIQAATIPDALAGADVCGRAPTGSGKTIAFGIPLIERVTRGAPRRPGGLVLVPTRELAAQVGLELRELAGPRGRSIAVVHGGVGFGPQISRLRRGADIVVACPGRLSDLVRQQEVFLDAVRFVVIDEADRMADMGFLPEVRRLLDMVHAKRQTLLFSATLDGDVDVLVRRYQRTPVRHDVAPADNTHRLDHVFWNTPRADRVNVLADVLRAQWPAIVFCRTKHGADRLTKQLTRAGVSAVAIHGDRSQGQRSRALEAFANGQVQALVATDVAARGIHVDDVAIVVHFDPPGSDKDYVHRSGRTGRAGQRGLVLSFIDHDQRHAATTLQRSLGLDSATESVDIRRLQVAQRDRPRTARATGTKRNHRDLARKQGRGPRRTRRR